MALVERSIAGMRKMTFPTSAIEATAWRSPQPIDKLIPSSRASYRSRSCHVRRPSWNLGRSTADGGSGARCSQIGQHKIRSSGGSGHRGRRRVALTVDQ